MSFYLENNVVANPLVITIIRVTLWAMLSKISVLLVLMSLVFCMTL